MQKSEVGVSGGPRELGSAALTLSYSQHFPEIDKNLEGYMNVRLRRKTLIKQVNCLPEITLKTQPT